MAASVGILARVDQVVADWRRERLQSLIEIFEMVVEPLVEVSGVKSSPVVSVNFLNSFSGGVVTIKVEPVLKFSSPPATVEEEVARVMLETLFAMVIEKGPLVFTVEV